MIHLNVPTKHMNAAKEAVDLFRRISNEKYKIELIRQSQYKLWFREPMYPASRGGVTVWGSMIPAVSSAITTLAVFAFELSTDKEAKEKILQYLENAKIDPKGLLLTDERPLRYDEILPHFLDAVFYLCDNVF